jgi:8-amino-7-oxononanoate synthase
MDLNERLESKLESLDQLDLRRSLPSVSTPQQRTITVDGDSYLNFSSNDYLGMAADYEVSQTAHAVLERYGIGSGGSRLVCGEHPLFERLESFLADWKQTESAVSFGSGYLTSLGVIQAILTGRDAVFYDELSHRCLLEAVELTDAEGHEFPHNDVERLDEQLQNQRNEYDAVLIVTEGIFSMDGDRAPIGPLADLSDRHDAWFMVDEAHSSGVWGPDGAGLTLQEGESVDLAMGTLSKAVGGYGGFVAGSETLREYLINRATTLIYSTGLPASVVAGNLSSLKKLTNRDQLREDLKDNVNRISEAFAERGIPLPDPPSQIVPLMTGSTDDTLEAGRIVREEGLYAVPIRHPTVPRNEGRLRFSLRADHSREDLGQLIEAVDRLDQADLIKRSDIWSL